MTRNEIVVERPSHGSAYAIDGSTNSAIPLRIWLPGGPEYPCLHVKTMGAVGVWFGVQVYGISDGQPRKCKFWPTGSGYGAAWSFPGSSWVSSTRYNRRVFQHLNSYDPVRLVRWTADQDYDAVAINCYWAATNGDIVTIALTGSGTLLESSLDCHSNSSPFKAVGDFQSQFFQMGTQDFKTIATGVKAGDVITFTPELGKLTEICSILGVLPKAYGTPADADSVHLTDNILVTGDPAIDAAGRHITQPRDTCGNSLAIQPTSNGSLPPKSFWGTDEHADANNTITGAGGSGRPTVLYTYYTAAHPEGVGWHTESPAQGVRKTCRAFRVLVVGEAKMFNTMVGKYRESLVIDALGYTHYWEIWFNGTFPATFKLVGGYSGMMRTAGLEDYALAPSLSAPVIMKGIPQDTGLNTTGHCVLLYGGQLNGRLIEFVNLGTEFAHGNTIRVDKKADGGNKIYGTLSAQDAVDVVPSANDRISGGYRLNVFQGDECRPLVPRGYRR